MNLKHIILILSFIISNGLYAQKRKANKDTNAWRYEIEAVQTGTQGTYLIKSWSYSKDPKVAIEQTKKNAVHGIVFKGFAGTAKVPGKSPLITDSSIEKEQEKFFKTFFADGGDYMKYVSLSNDGAVAAEDRMKIGKEYKIGVIVSVNVAQLRKALEDANIVKSLTSGF